MILLLLGSEGQLGRELQRALIPLGKLHHLSHQQLDIGNLKRLTHTLMEIKPHVILNAAAYTAVDRAEEEPELAMRVNSQAVAVMAEMATKLNSVLIHYSTDYVFDGTKTIPYTEDDPPNPINSYGKSKLAGEEAVVQLASTYLILRTSSVYSLTGENFVTKVLSWARHKKTLKIVRDQISSPTWAGILADCSAALLKQALKRGALEFLRERKGTYHVAGKGKVSRLDWAKAILSFDALKDEHVYQSLQPALTTDFPASALRPRYSAFDSSLFSSTFEIVIPGWYESLKHAMCISSELRKNSYEV